MRKYNMTAIMTTAWIYYRTERKENAEYTFSAALRRAWAVAKRKYAEEHPAHKIVNGWDITELEKHGAKRWTKALTRRKLMRKTRRCVLK